MTFELCCCFLLYLAVAIVTVCRCVIVVFCSAEWWYFLVAVLVVVAIIVVISCLCCCCGCCVVCTCCKCIKDVLCCCCDDDDWCRWRHVSMEITDTVPTHSAGATFSHPLPRDASAEDTLCVKNTKPSYFLLLACMFLSQPRHYWCRKIFSWISILLTRIMFLYVW